MTQDQAPRHPATVHLPAFAAHDLLARAGVIAAIGADMVFNDLEDALRAFRAQPKEETP